MLRALGRVLLLRGLATVHMSAEDARKSDNSKLEESGTLESNISGGCCGCREALSGETYRQYLV